MALSQGVDGMAEVCRCAVEVRGFASVFGTMAAPRKDMTFPVKARKLRIDLQQALVCVELACSRAIRTEVLTN